MIKSISCDRCDGTGHMSYFDACYIRDDTGKWPLRTYGCIKCEGLGEVDDEENEDCEV